MLKHSLVALFIAAIPIAFAGSFEPAHARDTSACAHNDQPATAKVPTPTDCLNASGQQPDGAKTNSPLPDQIVRADQFVYVFQRPENPSGEVIILLHGSGGNETSMFKLAARAAPHATLLGVRGRITQKGIIRWYTRVSPTEFDQDDIRHEAQALAGFLTEKMAAEKLDIDRATFIGYSNGANLIAAMTLLYPNLIHRAVLLRAMPVLHTVPVADLKRRRFLTVSGKMDKVYGPFAPALETLLRDRGATVDSYTIPGGHLLGDEDVKLVGEWLSEPNAVAGGTSQ